MKQAGQLCFPIRPQIKVVPGDVLSGKIEVVCVCMSTRLESAGNLFLKRILLFLQVSKAGENGRLLRVDLALRVNEGQESTYQISIE